MPVVSTVNSKDEMAAPPLRTPNTPSASALYPDASRPPATNGAAMDPRRDRDVATPMPVARIVVSYTWDRKNQDDLNARVDKTDAGKDVRVCVCVRLCARE